MVINMNQNKMKEKLKEFGKTIELDDSDIYHSKRMMKTLVCMGIIIATFTLIGLFSSRLEAIGQWYAGVSIRDFYMFRGFF